MLLVDVLPHDEEDGGADEAVLDRAREQERPRRRQQPRHDVVRVVVTLAQAQLQGQGTLIYTELDSLGYFIFYMLADLAVGLT